MSKKRKVVLGLTILVGLFCMAIGITAAAKENEPQLLHTEVTDDVTAYYVKEKGEYYLYTVVEEKKSEEEIQAYRGACTDPVETKLMEEDWRKLVAAGHSEGCEAYLLEDAECYRTCFVMKLEKDWINKEMLEEWEK